MMARHSGGASRPVSESPASRTAPARCSPASRYRTSSQFSKILLSPDWLAIISMASFRKCGSCARSAAIRASSMPVRVVGRHVPDIGLVGIAFGAHPWDLVAMAAEKLDRPEQCNRGQGAGDPAIGESHIARERIAVGPAQPRAQGIHHGRRAEHEKPDPVGLLQREQRLPERKKRDQPEPFHA